MKLNYEEKFYNGQFCPICDNWCELPESQEHGSTILCPQGHRLLVEIADSDYEDYHLKSIKES